MKKVALLVFFLIGALSMLIMSFHYFQYDDSGILRKKALASSAWFVFVFRSHILFGLFAMLTGIFQIPQKLRARYLGLHRKLGYCYVGSVVLSAMSGLVIAQFAMGGLTTRIGFTVLSMLWLYTTFVGVKAIFSKDEKRHRSWMYLSYGLTFSAITQRSLLLIPLLTSVPFMPIYQLSAWLPWIINLLIAYKIGKSRATNFF